MSSFHAIFVRFEPCLRICDFCDPPLAIFSTDSPMSRISQPLYVSYPFFQIARLKVHGLGKIGRHATHTAFKKVFKFVELQ